MSSSDSLPADFIQHLAKLEAAYLRESDPIRQSGFHGGPARWRGERSPILRAIPRSGTLLDVGCANGYLLESLMSWGSESGLTPTPYGVEVAGQPETARFAWLDTQAPGAGAGA
jgi:hypothetical protein